MLNLHIFFPYFLFNFLPFPRSPSRGSSIHVFLVILNYCYQRCRFTYFQGWWDNLSAKLSIPRLSVFNMPVRDVCFYFRRNSNHLRQKKNTISTFHSTFYCIFSPFASAYHFHNVFNNYSSSPNGLWVNSPFGLRPHGLLTQRPWGREE